jgi:hypothetical protein
MDSSTKVRENLARRMVARRGYRLVKSRRRDPKAVDYRRYRVEVAKDVEGIGFKSPDGHGFTLDEIEERLNG